jgi:iron complex outermembrane recepter protein
MSKRIFFSVGSALLALSVHTALADQGNPAAPQAAADAGEVVVIGTRRSDRTVVDSASPVDVISASDLREQPASNMLDELKYIVPSFFVGTNTISDASSIVRAPSLRGLPSDEILVMLNGKRFNRSALVQVYTGGDTELSFGSQGSDISSIPSIGIKNLEVLRDGATAQYGSDAIAGVMNYGLRDDIGFEVQAHYGEYPQFKDGKSTQFAFDYGFKVTDNGFVNIAVEYDHDTQTSRGGQRPYVLGWIQDNPSLAKYLPNYPGPVQIWGQSPSYGYKALINSEFKLTDNSKLYLFANIGYNHVDESFNYRFPATHSYDVTNSDGGVDSYSGKSFFQHPYYLTACPANNATCPSGGYVQDSNVFNFASIYPAGFTPRFVGKTTETYVTGGYKGKLDNGLTYDASVSSSENKVDLSMYNSLSPSYGAASQTSFEFGALIQKETNLALDLTYPLNIGWATPATLSGGAEFRKETYTATPGDVQSYGAGPYASNHELYTLVSPGVYADTGTQTVAEGPGASGYAGTSPTYAGTFSQTSHGVYVGLEGDVVQDLSLGFAGRYETYQSFGSKSVGKVNALWKASDTVSLRATLGTGFHAPSPGQSNVEVLTTSFSHGVSLQQGTFPVTSSVAQYYGAKALKPETSTNYGVGLVFKPIETWVTTLDLYQIDVKDRIFISGSYTVSDADITHLAELANVGSGGTVQYFTNGLDTSTKGVDLVTTYKTELLGGRANVSLAYNYNSTDVTKYDPAAIATYQILDIKNLAPHNRATLSLNWARDAWSVNLRENYFGSWTDANDYDTARDANGNVSAGQIFGAKITTDVDVSYHVNQWVATLGSSNLFNVYPDKIAASVDNPIYPITGTTYDGQIYPRNGGPFGFNGRFVFVNIGYKF